MTDPAVLHLGIVGDYDPASPRHAATYAGLQHAGERLGAALQVRWLATDAIDGAALIGLDGVFITTGSPYRSIEGVLHAIQHARVHAIPLLGTCGGFQHVVLEHARNVLGVPDAHAEYDSTAPNPLIAKLACPLVERTMHVKLVEGSRVHRAYSVGQVEESYYCSYGLNRDRESEVERAGLRITGRDTDSEPRVVERDDHPFFVATLFVPQTASRPDRPHPLLVAFLEAALRARA
jgi:CTP synthase (UTP-ammonia lyase)